MSFQTDAYNLKSKLHLSKLNTPMLIGICAAVLVVVFFVLQALYGLFASDSFELAKGELQTQEQTQGQSQGQGQEPGASQEDAGEVDAATGTQVKEGPAPVKLFVHVGGAVNKSGVYELESGARLFDAIEAAGGLREDAAAEAVNLARLLQDGEQVVVPTQAQVEAGLAAPSAAVAGAGASEDAGASSSGAANPDGKVNINTASQSELETLPGVGEATAKKIIAYREQNGSFGAVEDLKDVSGIGEKKYADLVSLICV